MHWLDASIKPILEKYKVESVLIGTAALVSLISGAIFINSSSFKANNEEIPTLTKATTSEKPKSTILVDLSGSVEKADVYEVSSSARLKDILILAGGLSQDADREFFKMNFNLARILRDQEKIYIPSEEETQSGAITKIVQTDSNGSNSVFGASNKVNINSATIEELDTLPGIGQVTAQKIIQNRPYSAPQELIDKKSVGKSVFEKIKDLISI